jgi:hypothetical protein
VQLIQLGDAFDIDGDIVPTCPVEDKPFGCNIFAVNFDKKRSLSPTFVNSSALKIAWKENMGIRVELLIGVNVPERPVLVSSAYQFVQ